MTDQGLRKDKSVGEIFIDAPHLWSVLKITVCQLL